MKKITSINELQAAIQALEIKQSGDSLLLKEQLRITGENLKPVNLIKNTFHDLVAAPDFKKDVLGSMLGNSAGYLTRKIMIGTTLNPLKLISGNLLQMLVTSIISKNTDEIKRVAGQFIQKIIRKKDKVVT